MEETNKERFNIGIFLWVFISTYFLNYYWLIPLLGYSERSRLFWSIAWIIAEFGFILIFGICSHFMLYPIVVLFKKIKNSNTEVVAPLLFIGVCSVVIFSLVIFVICVEVNGHKNLPLPIFELGEKVVCKIDPQKTEGVIVKHLYARDVDKKLRPNTYLPYHYEVRFISDSDPLTFKTEIFTEHELEKCSDFINYENAP